MGRIDDYDVVQPEAGDSALGVTAGGLTRRLLMGSSASRNVGTLSSEIPDTGALNSRLGTSGNLGSAAVRNIGAGLSDLADNTLLNERLGTAANLGTGASRDVTETPVDGMIGRLLEVGSFGIGSSLLALVDPNAEDLPTGIYSFSDTAVHYGLHIAGDSVSGAATQISLEETVDDSFNLTIRHKKTTMDGWSSWYPLPDLQAYPSDPEWTVVTELSNGWTGAIRYIKRLGTVTVVADVSGTGKSNNTLMVLPVEYRPSIEIPAAVQEAGKGLTISVAGVVSSDVTTAAGRAVFSYLTV